MKLEFHTLEFHYCEHLKNRASSPPGLPARPGEKKFSQWNSSSTGVNAQKTEQAICLKQSIFANGIYLEFLKLAFES